MQQETWLFFDNGGGTDPALPGPRPSGGPSVHRLTTSVGFGHCDLSAEPYPAGESASGRFKAKFLPEIF
jgi:hypothetical protein